MAKEKYEKKLEKKVEKKYVPSKTKKKVEVILVKENSLIILIDGNSTTMKREDKHKDVSIGDIITA